MVRDATTGRPVNKTSHTLNPVAFMVHGRGPEGETTIDPAVARPGLAT